MVAMGSIPTRLLLQPSRLSMAEGQRQLAQAQVESGTGRHHDIGLVLGSRTGTDLSLRLTLSGLEQARASAGLAAAGADTVQNSLSSLSSIAVQFRSGLMGARNAEGGRNMSVTAARTALDALRDALSVTQDGIYLFSGMAGDQPPLRNYDEGPRQAVIDAFQAAFGFPPSDPAAASLTASDVDGFIKSTSATLFSGPGWAASWSSSTDQTPRFRLPTGSGLDLSASVNAPFAQKMTQALSLMDVLGSSRLNAEALTSAVDSSLSLVSEAQVAIADEQARIGIGQSRLKEWQSSLGQQTSRVTAAVSALESVDPYEAATRVNLLMTQLESSYALTGRISRMNLLSYL